MEKRRRIEWRSLWAPPLLFAHLALLVACVGGCQGFCSKTIQSPPEHDRPLVTGMKIETVSRVVTTTNENCGFLQAAEPPAEPVEGLRSVRDRAVDERTTLVAEPIPIPASMPRGVVLADPPSVFTLEDAIRLAAVSNPDLNSAEQRICVASAILARARAEFYPQLGVSEAFGVTNNAVNAFMFELNEGRFQLGGDLNHPGTVDDFHTQLLAQQRLYDGGRRAALQDAAAAGQDVARFALAAAQNELVFRVAEAYYRTFQSQQLVTVRDDSVRQVQRHLEIVKSREHAGTAVKSDVLTVEVHLAEVEEGQITARHQEELAWAVLENVCGAPISQRILPSQPPTAPWSSHVLRMEAAVAEARSCRPEVAGISREIEAAGHEMRAAAAGKCPTVDLAADYDVFTPNFAQGNDSWFVGAVVKFNLFDGKRTQSEVQQAQARLCELRAKQQRLLLDIELGVRRAYLQLEDAKQRVQVAERAIGQAGESLREIEVRYRGQAASITELVDAQVAVLRTQVRHTAAQADVEVATAALEQAGGRLSAIMEH